MQKKYDVIVVGGGHAGIEAATASCRVGAITCLITKTQNDLGELSCNPSVGGVAKGIIVKEIDALDGIMSKIIDKSGIHFKVLNKSRGPAVWGVRAQADRELYKNNVQNILFSYKNLDIVYSTVDDIAVVNKKISGVVCKGIIIKSNSVVISSGTFLNGTIHIGDISYKAGRLGEKSITKLAKKLKYYKFCIKRLKTGTPPRILNKSINWKMLEEQLGDKMPESFSDFTKNIAQNQASCYITHTTSNTHEIIKNNLTKSAMYYGNIISAGPRYCPSIEDKIVKFRNKKHHQIFLEPEGFSSNLVYPNGVSTSLPPNIQKSFIQSVPGLEKANLIRYGYAIEYDFIDPRALKETLESVKIKNLFFAGQINGTTGYEEAGAQGILAGINAALKLQNKKFIIFRHQGYMGVMINDLINFGTQEPYRMMTSRAEYRIKLRGDNASERLTPISYKYNIISSEKLNNFNLFIKKKQKMVNFFQNKKIFKKYSNFHYSQYNDTSYIKQKYSTAYNIININSKIIVNVFAYNLYKYYEKRLNKDINILRNDNNINIPVDINYDNINGLSNEIREKLKKKFPGTIANMKRIQGVTPSALISVTLYIKKITK